MASGPDANKMSELSRTLGIRVTSNNAEAARFGHVVVFGVKPQILLKVLDEVKEEIDADNLVVMDHTWNKVWVINFDRDPVWLRPLKGKGK
jgi:pyrroline-5-carboxylate reductase